MFASHVFLTACLGIALASASLPYVNRLSSSTEHTLIHSSLVSVGVEPHLADHDLLQSRGSTESEGLFDSLVSIYDTTKTLQLFPTSNGNVNVSVPTASKNWGAANSSVFADSSDRLLHYFPDTMQTYGVSRFRVAAWGSIPRTANLISLVQMSGNGSSLLFAIDSFGYYFYPVACVYSDGSNKVFLIQDSTKIDTLLDASLRYIVTGGIVSECTPLALESSGLSAIGS
ncbi:hypothetical protein ANO11243_061630 [Dothideomycetidae sp. 11243]|nr:hypothetical protein ANO11243_061630 [fungal sp. No.11243]